MTRSVKALAVVAGLLLPAQAQAETYVFDYSNPTGPNPKSVLTRGGFEVDRLFFLKGDEFDLTFRFTDGLLNDDNFTGIDTVVQDDTRITFTTTKVVGTGLPFETGTYGFVGAQHDRNDTSHYYRAYYPFNVNACHGEAYRNPSFYKPCIFQSEWLFFVHGETDGDGSNVLRSTTYHVTVSSVPLPAAASGLLAGLAALFGVARRRRG